jgi:hypothetical protein
MAVTKKVIQKRGNLKGKKEGSKAPKNKVTRTATPTVVLAEESEKEEEVDSVDDHSESDDGDDTDTEETDSDHYREEQIHEGRRSVQRATGLSHPG